nr:outer membrane beta-barrel family protein [Pedobacter panaciterrae]
MKRTIRKCFFLILSSPLFISDAYSQNERKITGKVTDEASRPIAYAAVSLLHIDSTAVKGSLTTETGEFIFPNVPHGSYLIAIEAMGYEKLIKGPITINQTNNDHLFGNITLSVDVQQLNTVSITAKKPLIQRKSDKVVLNVANSILTAGNSALDILSKAPGVSVDNEGNISLKGKRGVSIMLDGKLTYLSGEQLTALLRATSGNSIESIEMMSNPSAKYDASGSAGIINIKLKKSQSDGTNGTITAGSGYGKYYKYNGGLMLNHRVNKLNLFGDYNYSENKDFQNLNVNRSNTDGAEQTFFDQIGREVYLHKDNSYRAGIDYYINDKSVLGFSINGSFKNVNIASENRTLMGSKAFTHDSSVVAINPGRSRYTDQTYNLNYKVTLDTLGQEFNADVDYAHYYSNNKTIYNNYFYNAIGNQLKPPLIYRNATPSNVNILVGKVDYTLPLASKMKLEAGIKNSYVKTDNDFQFENLQKDSWNNDISRSNKFIYKEQVSAAYVNIHKDYKSTTVQVGLRAEFTHSEGNSLTANSLVKRNYLDIFPSIFINQILNPNHEIGISYSKRIDRPDYQSLNPFLYFSDLYTYNQGNPLLNPQYTNAFEFSYGYKKILNATLGYSATRDVITTTLLTDSIKKTLLIKDQNLASENTINLNISAPLTITKWWSTNNEFTLYHTNYSAPELMGVPFKSSKLTWLANITQTFQLKPTLSAELTASYQSAQIYGTYKVKPIYGVDLGLSKSFADNKMNLKLAVTDVFNQRKAYISSAITQQDYKVYQKPETRVYRLTFTYNFGSILIKAIRERSNGSSAEQNRAKSGN